MFSLFKKKLNKVTRSVLIQMFRMFRTWRERDYYNDHIQKYHVIYSDNSEDYIGEDEIDMVDICVV